MATPRAVDSAAPGAHGPSRFSQMLTRAVVPNSVVDFPLRDAAGEPLCKVFIRPLTQREQDNARINAATYVARMAKGSEELKWRPEELEENALAAEILAIACREADDPSKPLFDLGVIDARECSTETLAMLFNAYNEVREKAYPTLSQMDEDSMWAMVRVLEEGAREHPFTHTSRVRVEAFATWAAKSLASLSALLIGLTASSSQPSPSGESGTSSEA